LADARGDEHLVALDLAGGADAVDEFFCATIAASTSFARSASNHRELVAADAATVSAERTHDCRRTRSP